MKSSAIVTAVSFVAATALGAALFTGCSVSSGTIDDTDGGEDPPKNDSGSNNEDAGSDSGDSGGSTCSVPTREGTLVSVTCQNCLDDKCCSQQQACYSIPGDPDAGKLDCNKYGECAVDCDKKPEAEQEDCYDLCELVAADSVPETYNQMLICRDQNCATECTPK